jgi:hypothetical protein
MSAIGKTIGKTTELLEVSTVHETLITLVVGQCANCKDNIGVYADSKPPHYCNPCRRIMGDKSVDVTLLDDIR